MFWVAATIPKNDLHLNVFFVGDTVIVNSSCIFHGFGPRQTSEIPDPFFINAEYVLEDMQYIGEVLPTDCIYR